MASKSADQSMSIIGLGWVNQITIIYLIQFENSDMPYLCGILSLQYGVLTLDLSPYVLEIHTDLLQHSVKIWLAVQHSVKNTTNWLVDDGKQSESNIEH